MRPIGTSDKPVSDPLGGGRRVGMNMTNLVITSDSHLDHGLSAAHLAFLFKAFLAPEEPLLDFVEPKVTIQTFQLPDELEGLSCGLYGPSCGDAPVPEAEVVYQRRGTRHYESRMVDRPFRTSRLMTVVAGPHNGYPYVLFTVYGGPPAPREVRDPHLPEEERAEAEAFWAQHALAL